MGGERRVVFNGSPALESAANKKKGTGGLEASEWSSLLGAIPPLAGFRFGRQKKKIIEGGGVQSGRQERFNRKCYLIESTGSDCTRWTRTYNFSLVLYFRGCWAIPVWLQLLGKSPPPFFFPSGLVLFFFFFFPSSSSFLFLLIPPSLSSSFRLLHPLIQCLSSSFAFNLHSCLIFRSCCIPSSLPFAFTRIPCFLTLFFDRKTY